MKNSLDFSLTAEERQELERTRVHNEITEVRVRCEAILALGKGERVLVVAQANDVTPHTIYAWHKRYKTGGIAALSHKPRSGRPRKWTPEYLAQLESTLETDPKTLGYDFSLWTLERLAAHLAKVTNIELTSRSLLDLMERENYRYLRPKYGIHHLQDAEAVATARANLEELKKAQSDPTSQMERSTYSLWTKQH